MPLSPAAPAHSIRRALNQLPFLPRALGLVRESAGKLMWASLGLLLVQGLLPLAPMLLIKALVEALVRGAGLKSALVLVGLLGLSLLLMQALESLARWVRTLQSERVQDHLSGLIQFGCFDCTNRTSTA